MPPSEAEIRTILQKARRIAVVGLRDNPARPAYGVAAYLHRAGYEIVPVHPLARTVFGREGFADLESAAAAGPIDIVDIFRRAETIPALVPGCVAVRPMLVWLQAGIRHDGALAALEAAGIPAVQDRCLAVDHKLMGI
ncbi:MAG TPA: CoA-binding protein [Gemmatimonadales bacterium]|nr:CoA-binding protein [Gemmatimonadales bacterium]